MDIAPHGKTHDPLAVRHHHDAGLGIERHELLQDAGNRKQGQRPGDVGLRLQHPLPVAVVAQRAGFQHGGKPQPPHGFAQRRFVVHGLETGRAQPVVAGVRLLAQAVLRIVKGFVALRDVVFPAQRNQNIPRYVFEFIGHRVAAAAQFLERRGIVVGRNDMIVANVERRSVGRRVEAHGAHAQFPRLLGDHQPQLTATYDTDGLH